jgi:hypothetical protein
MLPCVASDKMPDYGLGDAIFNAKSSLRYVASSVFFSDGQHLAFRQFGARDVFAFSLPPFGNLIGHVVGLRSKKQVRRIDARRIVTTMKGVKPV